MYELLKTTEFEDWLAQQPLKSRIQVEERLLHIACEGHFGVHKRLTDQVCELYPSKFKNWTEGDVKAPAIELSEGGLY